MTVEFDIDKIVSYLEKYKSDLPKLYKWKTKIERLIELEILTNEEIEELEVQNELEDFEKGIRLKKIVCKKLNEVRCKNHPLFEKLCFWIIKDWGGIKSASEKDTIDLIESFLNTENPSFKRIASTSKVGAFLFPEKNVIYDSRVAYSINWIILSENAGQHYFPIPEGRNSKMTALDMNVLIRLKNISMYQQENITCLDDRLFIQNSDKQLFIDKKIAYSEFNKLIKQINQKLWKGDEEKAQNLYYTEMLLFSIADREIFQDITKRWNELIKTY